MTENIKDNKNTVKYKDFWIDGVTVHGVFRNILAELSRSKGKTQKQIINEAVFNYANQQGLKDEMFKIELAVIDDFIKQHTSNGRDLLIDDLAKIIARYTNTCFKADKYQRLKELSNFVKQLSLKDEDERRI